MVCVCVCVKRGRGEGGRILSALNLFFGEVWSNTNSRSGWWEMSENNNKNEKGMGEERGAQVGRKYYVTIPNHVCVCVCFNFYVLLLCVFSVYNQLQQGTSLHLIIMIVVSHYMALHREGLIVTVTVDNFRSSLTCIFIENASFECLSTRQPKW